jgi:hypothetical protein
MKIDVNMGTIWTMLVGTVGAVVYMFNNFVSAAEFKEFQVDGWYTAYYILLDKRDEAEEKDKEELAAEIERQMERLHAKICEEDPKWERCKENNDGS